jgi:hypothetical protein
MLSVGKLFAVAAILALIVGFVPWPVEKTGLYTISIGNRAYGFSADYWAFSVGAVFAVLAALYYWLPFIFSLHLSVLASNLHFWLSAIPAFAILLLVPVWQTLARSTPSTASGERGAITIVVVSAVSILLFLVAQSIFLLNCVWSALYRRNA